MSRNIRGITIEIGGNTQRLQDSLRGVNTQSRDLQGELRQVERLLKLDPKNTELLAQKQRLLTDAVENTKNKLETLKEAQRQVADQFARGEVGAEQYRAIQRELIQTQQELGRLETELRNVNNRWRNAAEGIGNFGTKAQELGEKLAPLSAAGGAVAGGMIALAVNAGKAADDLNTLSKQTGLSTETLQKFQLASDIIDVSMETLTGSLTKLTRNMGAAKDGSKTAEEAFKRLGVAFKDDLTGELKDNEEVFNEAITALGKIGNETERDALAMELFGKSAQDLNPLILGGADALKKMGEEAEAAGLILSQDALDAANEFNDELDVLKATAGGTFAQMGLEIGKALLPLLKQLAEVLKGVMAWMRGLDENTLRWIFVIAALVAAIAPALMAIGLMASGISAVMTAVTVLGPAITALGPAIAFITGPIGLVILAVTALIAIFAYLWNANEEFRNRVIELWEGLKSFLVATLDSIKDKFGFVWEAIAQVFGAFGKLFEGDFKGFLSDIFNAATTWLSGWGDIGKDMVKGIWNGITSMAVWLGEKIGGFFSGILKKAKSALGINSPSKVFSDVIGKNMALGVGTGFKNNISAVNDAITRGLNTTARTAEMYGSVNHSGVINIKGYNDKGQFTDAVEMVIDRIRREARL